MKNNFTEINEGGRHEENKERGMKKKKKIWRVPMGVSNNS